jgi:hypothetical protein
VCADLKARSWPATGRWRTLGDRGAIQPHRVLDASLALGVVIWQREAEHTVKAVDVMKVRFTQVVAVWFAT